MGLYGWMVDNQDIQAIRTRDIDHVMYVLDIGDKFFDESENPLCSHIWVQWYRQDSSKISRDPAEWWWHDVWCLRGFRNLHRYAFQNARCCGKQPLEMEKSIVVLHERTLHLNTIFKISLSTACTLPGPGCFLSVWASNVGSICSKEIAGRSCGSKPRGEKQAAASYILRERRRFKSFPGQSP